MRMKDVVGLEMVDNSEFVSKLLGKKDIIEIGKNLAAKYAEEDTSDVTMIENRLADLIVLEKKEYKKCRKLLEYLTC